MPTETADLAAGDLVAVFIDPENLALGAGENLPPAWHCALMNR